MNAQQPERAELSFQQGGSDKVYHLQLEHVNGTWSVAAQWGRRGSALQSDVKVAGASYDDAKRLYDRTLKEKLAKGYKGVQASGSATTPSLSVGPSPTKEFSGHAPELLTPIDEPDALQLIPDAAWWFQQKFDGRRLAVEKANGQYSGINKLGQIISIDAQLSACLNLAHADAFLVDGEITGSRFDVWDLLDLDHVDLRGQPYESRYEDLIARFHGAHDLLRVADTARTAAAKQRFVDTMQQIHAEGFVCKNRHAVYASGRAGQHFKCKFVTTASLIVGPKPKTDGHRSIGLYLLDEGRERFMGTVGVPERYPVPDDGQVVEVRYLYCHPGPDGKLIQAKYFGQVRDDIAHDECSVSQLKLKAEPD